MTDEFYKSHYQHSNDKDETINKNLSRLNLYTSQTNIKRRCKHNKKTPENQILSR